VGRGQTESFNKRLQLSTDCPEGVHSGQKGVGAVIHVGLTSPWEKEPIALSRRAGLLSSWLRPEIFASQGLVRRGQGFLMIQGMGQITR